MDWLGQASIEFTHAPKPVQLTSKDGTETKDLAQFCRDTTPPCQLNPLLFNGHMQTMYTAVGKDAPLIYYRRKIFQSTHKQYGGSFAVDFVVDPHNARDPGLPPRTTAFTEDELAQLPSDDSRPMLLILHGLSGGSYEVYLRHCIGPLIADGRDWAVAVVTARGCAGSPITSGYLFNARATWDVRQVALWARETFPNRPLFGLGFSLGANILTNYVGEEGVHCPLSAAVAVGNPFDLQISSKALQRTFMGRNVYENIMGSALKKLIGRHKKVLQQLTDLDFDVIENTKYIYDFDRAVQCPSWGYPTEEAYYRDASSVDSVMGIRIPFLALHSKDDPIAVDEAVPYGELKLNPYTVMCATSLGGHLAFYEPGGGRWHPKPICNFLHKMATEVDLKAIPREEHITTNESNILHFDPMRRKMDLLRGH